MVWVSLVFVLSTQYGPEYFESSGLVHEDHSRRKVILVVAKTIVLQVRQKYSVSTDQNYVVYSLKGGTEEKDVQTLFH